MCLCTYIKCAHGVWVEVFVYGQFDLAEVLFKFFSSHNPAVASLRSLFFYNWFIKSGIALIWESPALKFKNQILLFKHSPTPNHTSFGWFLSSVCVSGCSFHSYYIILTASSNLTHYESSSVPNRPLYTQCPITDNGPTMIWTMVSLYVYIC